MNFGLSKKKLAQDDNIATVEVRDNYLRVFKGKRKSAHAEIQYYQEKLEQLKSKLIYL